MRQNSARSPVSAGRTGSAAEVPNGSPTAAAAAVSQSGRIYNRCVQIQLIFSLLVYEIDFFQLDTLVIFAYDDVVSYCTYFYLHINTDLSVFVATPLVAIIWNH